MAAVELLTNIYDTSEPRTISLSSLCTSCKYKGKSFLCLLETKHKDGIFPDVNKCRDYKPFK